MFELNTSESTFRQSVTVGDQSFTVTFKRVPMQRMIQIAKRSGRFRGKKASEEKQLEVADELFQFVDDVLQDFHDIKVTHDGEEYSDTASMDKKGREAVFNFMLSKQEIVVALFEAYSNAITGNDDEDGGLQAKNSDALPST